VAKSKVDARKIRAAHNHMVWVIEYLGGSNLVNASGDSLLLDDANRLRNRIREDAKRIGVDAERL